MAGADVTQKYQGASPAIVSEVLRLADVNGGALTERVIVDAASDPASPLHDQFQWDNDVAADGFRVIQARLLINRVKIKVTQGETVTVMPAFVSITNGQGNRVRIGTQRAMADPDMLGQVLAETRSQLVGLRNRLTAFNVTGDLVDGLDDVLSKIPAV